MGAGGLSEAGWGTGWAEGPCPWSFALSREPRVGTQSRQWFRLTPLGSPLGLTPLGLWASGPLGHSSCWLLALAPQQR